MGLVCYRTDVVDADDRMASGSTGYTFPNEECETCEVVGSEWCAGRCTIMLVLEGREWQRYCYPFTTGVILASLAPWCPESAWVVGTVEEGVVGCRQCYLCIT